jgi:hypothetical protein
VKSTCATCGYSWTTGQDGSHSCTRVLLVEIAKLRAENEQLRLMAWANTRGGGTDEVVDAAYQDGAESMRERCAKACDERSEAVAAGAPRVVAKMCARDIRALPLADEEQRHK